MKLLQQIASAVLYLGIATFVGTGVWWLVTNKPTAGRTEKHGPAATVDRVIPEADLNILTLTADEERLTGVTVGTVAMKSAPRVRIYGGEVTAPIGKTVLVAAPLGGTLKAPKGGVPLVGATVKTGQAVLELLPILTPEGRATISASYEDADGQVNNAKTQLDLAQVTLDRAKRVQQGGAGSLRQVQEAQAAYDLASRTHDAARARRGALAKVLGEGKNADPVPIALDSPEDGILRAMSALPGQTVPSGAPLFEVIDLSTVWIRVPLPVGDYDEINRTASAEIGNLSGRSEKPLAKANPVTAPPSANPLASTIDVFYEMPNPAGKLTPGQRLGVTIPLDDAKESLIVPWSALVFDVHGGTWLYQPLGQRRFVRHRAVVRYTLGPDAVLASGPPSGTQIVTRGSQELFGLETGFKK